MSVYFLLIKIDAEIVNIIKSSTPRGMLYPTKSPYYRQFLSSAVNKKYQKNLEKAQGTSISSENKETGNPSSGKP